MHSFQENTDLFDIDIEDMRRRNKYILMLYTHTPNYLTGRRICFKQLQSF